MMRQGKGAGRHQDERATRPRASGFRGVSFWLVAVTDNRED